MNKDFQINRWKYNGTSWTNICTTAVANIMELVWKVYTLNNVSENYGRKVNWDIYLCTSIASYMMYLVKQINVNIFAPLFFSLVKGGDPIFCAFEDLWTSIQNCLTTFRKCDNDRYVHKKIMLCLINNLWKGFKNDFGGREIKPKT